MFNFSEKADAQLQKDVMNEIRWDPRVTSLEINADAKDGVITLRGSVPHYSEKSTAEKAAQRVSGVRAVADEMEVNIMGTYQRSDSDIAKVALDALKWNYQVPDNVQVVVDRSWVTLLGEADWDYEREAAKDAVSMIIGVSGVTNEMTLKERAQPDDIKARIEQALRRSAEIDGKKIEVSVDGGEVTLSGRVESFAEIEDAKLAAWNSPGVIRVVNDLILVH